MHEKAEQLERLAGRVDALFETVEGIWDAAERQGVTGLPPRPRDPVLGGFAKDEHGDWVHA